MNWLGILIGVVAMLGFAERDAAAQSVETAREESATQIRTDIEYLAGEPLEGRGILTSGNQKAADYLRERFQALGLQPGAGEGEFFQKFPIVIGTSLNESSTRLLLKAGSTNRTLELKTDFIPFIAGTGGAVRSDIVFAGYGITAPEENYDDYASIDVKGKVVIILRKEPGQQDDGPFQGQETTEHAFITTKLSVAQKAGAAAVLIVNDSSTVAEAHGKDVLAEMDAFGKKVEDIPFAQVTRDAVNQLLLQAPLHVNDQQFSSLDAIEQHIHKTLQPISQPWTGITADLDFAFEEQSKEVANVIGIIPGRNTNEYVIVGAHFDHIGYGEVGSRTPGVQEIHNGADDNASGTAALLELARRVAAGDTPPRNVVFMGFNGEERGLLGSNYFVAHPTFPLENTLAMINFDMVGRWKDNVLTLYGVGTAEEFDELIAELPKEVAGRQLNPVDNVLSASDHYGFYLKEIPVFHFFSGLTEEYHTPKDDIETLDFDGIALTVNIAKRVLDEILAEPDRFEYATVDIEKPGRGTMSYLGVIPDYAGGTEGLKINGTSPESPAEASGFQAGDIIRQFGDVNVLGIEGLTRALRTYKPGDTVDVKIRRNGADSQLKVTLGRPTQSSR